MTQTTDEFDQLEAFQQSMRSVTDEKTGEKLRATNTKERSEQLWAGVAMLEAKMNRDSHALWEIVGEMHPWEALYAALAAAEMFANAYEQATVTDKDQILDRIRQRILRDAIGVTKSHD